MPHLQKNIDILRSGVKKINWTNSRMQRAVFYYEDVEILIYNIGYELPYVMQIMCKLLKSREE